MTIRSLPTRRPVPIRMEATLPAHCVAVSVALCPACTRCPIATPRGTPLVELLSWFPWGASSPTDAWGQIQRHMGRDQDVQYGWHVYGTSLTHRRILTCPAVMTKGTAPVVNPR